MKNDLKFAADPQKVAYCGLYCGACPRHTKGSCPGCHDNAKATWCKVRTCCMENSYSSCAECKEPGHEGCHKFNNFMAKIFGFIFNSDRSKCIDRIKETGLLAYSIEMSEKGAQTVKRK